MRKSLFCLCICVMLVFTSCSSQEMSTPTIDINELDFSQQLVTLCEAENALGATYGLTKNMEVAELDGTFYAFEVGVSLADRAACVQVTEELLDRIGLDENIQIHIFSEKTYDCSFVNDGSIFTYLQDWKSPGYVSTLLLGIFGDYCNYGLIYGYANYLCHDIFDTPIDVYGKDWNYNGELNALDLNLLCFRSEFFSEIDIESIQRISNTFVAEFIQAKGIANFHKLLENSGDTQNVDAFTDTLAQFYASKSIDYMPSNILYRLGGRSYDYIVNCEYATMYIEKDWYDGNKDLCPYTYDGFLHHNYEDARKFFSINIKQMGQYQDLFSLDSYNNDLGIYFTNHYDRMSVYEISKHAISVMNTGSLMHEYIHALTANCIIPEKWAGEGFARYFGYRYDYYGNGMNNADYNSIPETDRFRYIHEYKQNVGRDIDIAKDFEVIQHITTYVYSYDDPNDAGGYASGASFIGYLISRFGEEKVIEIICKTHNFGENTFDELVSDWLLFINENYSAYSKYKNSI